MTTVGAVFLLLLFLICGGVGALLLITFPFWFSRSDLAPAASANAKVVVHVFRRNPENVRKRKKIYLVNDVEKVVAPVSFMNNERLSEIPDGWRPVDDLDKSAPEAEYATVTIKKERVKAF